MQFADRRSNVLAHCLVGAAALVTLVISPAMLSQVSGQTPPEQTQAEKPTATESTKSEAERHAEFSKKLSGSTLVGHFTVDGRQGDLKEERYELESVTKLPAGDLWLFKTRIRYGDHDVTVVSIVDDVILDSERPNARSELWPVATHTRLFDE